MQLAVAENQPVCRRWTPAKLSELNFSMIPSEDCRMALVVKTLHRLHGHQECIARTISTRVLAPRFTNTPTTTHVHHAATLYLIFSLLSLSYYSIQQWYNRATKSSRKTSSYIHAFTIRRLTITETRGWKRMRGRR